VEQGTVYRSKSIEKNVKRRGLELGIRPGTYQSIDETFASRQYLQLPSGN